MCVAGAGVMHGAMKNTKATGGVCLGDGKTGIGHDETSLGAGPGGWRSALPQPVNVEITAEGPNGYADGRDRRSSGKYRLNWLTHVSALT